MAADAKVASRVVARATDSQPLQRRVLADHAYERPRELILDRRPLMQRRN